MAVMKRDVMGAHERVQSGMEHIEKIARVVCAKSPSLAEELREINERDFAEAKANLTYMLEVAES